MRDDELQVLGKPRKMNKQEKRRFVIIVFSLLAVIVALGFEGYYFLVHEHEEVATKNPGDPTIVPELQECVDSLLNCWLDSIDGTQGQVIVMEVQTGEILAMAGRERRFDGTFQPCKNFAYQQELGSLTKTASLLAALETDEVRLNDVVDVGNGVYKVDEELQMMDHNWRRGGYGEITLDRALEISSNIGIGKAVIRAFGSNQQGFFDMLNKMSFGQPDQIDGIDGLKPTVYTSPKDSDWITRRIWWSAIGYERLIAPIQMLTFYNAIANDGKMVKPTLKVGKVEVINPQIASKKNIKLMQETLEHVITRGLGKKAGISLIPIAGKTGTSHVNEYYEGEAFVTEYQLAFCGYFPADAPKYSMIVSMNKLGLPASGGGMAGALFHDITEWMITHDMPPVLMIDEEKNDTIRITEDNIKSITGSQ